MFTVIYRMRDYRDLNPEELSWSYEDENRLTTMNKECLCPAQNGDDDSDFGLFSL